MNSVADAPLIFHKPHCSPLKRSRWSCPWKVLYPSRDMGDPGRPSWEWGEEEENLKVERREKENRVIELGNKERQRQMLTYLSILWPAPDQEGCPVGCREEKRAILHAAHGHRVTQASNTHPVAYLKLRTLSARANRTRLSNSE